MAWLVLIYTGLAGLGVWGLLSRVSQFDKRTWGLRVGWGWVGLGWISLATRWFPSYIQTSLALGWAIIGFFLIPVWLYSIIRFHPLLLPLLGWHAWLWIRSIQTSQLLLLPPYRDPAIHSYLLLDVFLNIPIQGWHPLLSRHFYHFHFHAVVASFFWAIRVSFSPFALHYHALFFWLFLYPISTYYLAYISGQPSFYAMLTAWIATSLWNMPQHALNWGKYPALFGLSLLPLALGERVQNQHFFPKDIRLLLFHIWIIFSLFFVHARIAVIFLILYLAMHIKAVGFLENYAVKAHILFTVVTLIILSYYGIHLRAYKNTLWVLPLFWFLLYKEKHKSLKLAALALTAWLSASIILIPPGLFLEDPTFLIDRPLFELSFCLPLSWLLGISISKIKIYIPTLTARISLFLVTLWIIFSSWQHPFSPRREVTLVQEDDLLAQAILAKTALPNSIVLIGMYQGGEWIPYLIEMQTAYIKQKYQKYWWKPEVLYEYCADYPQVFVYVDLQPFTIPLPPPLSYINIIVQLPGVHIYEVDCDSLPVSTKTLYTLLTYYSYYHFVVGDVLNALDTAPRVQPGQAEDVRSTLGQWKIGALLPRLLLTATSTCTLQETPSISWLHALRNIFIWWSLPLFSRIFF